MNPSRCERCGAQRGADQRSLQSEAQASSLCASCNKQFALALRSNSKRIVIPVAVGSIAVATVGTLAPLTGYPAFALVAVFIGMGLGAAVAFWFHRGARKRFITQGRSALPIAKTL